MRLVPRRRELNVGFKLSVAALSTAGTVYLSIVGLKLVHGRAPWEIAAVVMDAVVALGASVRAAYYEARKPSIQKRRAAVRQALEAAWLAVHQDTGIELIELLVSYFTIEGHGKRAHLRRILRVGLRQIPHSNVRWEKGKGAVGACWQAEATVRRDLTRLNAQHGTCGRAQWDALSPSKRMNMSYEDWVKTRRKYDMIIAVPVQIHREFVGCVALTGPKHNTTWLQRQEVEQALVAAAATISQAN